MCTKELAALTTVLLLALGTAISMISLSGVVVWFQPRLVPAKSQLATFDWREQGDVAAKVTKAVADDYNVNGYAVIRDVIDPKAIALLLEEAKRLCKYQLMVSKVCQIEEGRWQSDLVRDFLFHSNVSALVGKLVRDHRDPPMRVYQDGILAVTSSWIQPLFFTFTKHVDHGGMPGVWHGLHSDSVGAGLWIPLVEVDPNVTGGGIELYESFPQHGCQMIWGEKSTVDGFDQTINMSKVTELCTKHTGDTNNTVVPAVKPGDVVAWWPQMMHKTQRVKQSGFVRYALYVRVVTNDTMVCMNKDCGWKGRPCCSLALPKSGAVLKSPCYPQVYPSTIESEVKMHFSKRPQPMVDRSKMVSKYSSDVFGSMHAVCKKHRQGGPKRLWEALKFEAPLPERSRPPVVNTTEFDCEHAEHEGDCWRLDPEGLNLALVPWWMLNYTMYGANLFFSKDIEDPEIMYRIPWGATVRGVQEENNWLRIGDYYARSDFAGARMVPVGGEAATNATPADPFGSADAAPKAAEPAAESAAEPAAAREEEPAAASAAKRSDEL